MKDILTKLVFFTLVLFCISSCFKEADYGYPKNVYFPKEGGELTVTGDEWFIRVSVNTINRDSASEWLKVGYTEDQHYEFTIYAEPNTTGKSRTKYIRINFGPDYSEIKVKQGK